MNIDELITNVKKKIKKNINIENILIEDKTFLHKNHPGHENNKFHLKITIKSEELKKLNKKSNFIAIRVAQNITLI